MFHRKILRTEERLNKQTFEVILLDMNFNSSINTGNEGIFWLRKIREFGSDAAVIMITAYGDIDLAVRSLKEGAADFVVKPWHNEKLIRTIREALEKKESVKGTSGFAFQQDSVIGKELLGESEVMHDIFLKVEKVAPTDANILILGENGTGKDLIAKAIHQRSHRQKQPFIKVDVGALTETLFESELFGHKKGAFTMRDRWPVESAQGALFWMRWEYLSSTTEQAINGITKPAGDPVGTSQPIPIDIRLICATNLPLTELANESKFERSYIQDQCIDHCPPLRKGGRILYYWRGICQYLLCQVS
jgi:DNA-binding NtrC family response regulator